MASDSPRVIDSAEAEAAAVICRLMEQVAVGEIEADTPQARRIVRRLEGAVAAWEEGAL